MTHNAIAALLLASGVLCTVVSLMGIARYIERRNHEKMEDFLAQQARENAVDENNDRNFDITN